MSLARDTFFIGGDNIEMTLLEEHEDDSPRLRIF